MSAKQFGTWAPIHYYGDKLILDFPVETSIDFVLSSPLSSREETREKKKPL